MWMQKSVQYFIYKGVGGDSLHLKTARLTKHCEVPTAFWIRGDKL